jgi:drug/metabolite transporter (DMT)-like permease
MWLLYTILAILSRAVYGVLTKVLSNHIKVNPITQTVFLMLAATALSALALPFTGGFYVPDLGELWPILIITLATSAIGNIAYFKGIAKLESGTTQIAFSSILIWGLIMATIFLGTRLSFIQGVGVIALLIAILLAQYQKKAFTFQPGIWWILLSAASFSGFQVASALLSERLNLGTYLVFIYLGTAVFISIPYGLLILRDLQKSHQHLSGLAKTAVVTAFASVLNYVFLYFAYREAPDPGVVVLLLTSQVVVAVILSVIFLKERTNVWLKIGAGVLAMIAAILIKV